MYKVFDWEDLEEMAKKLAAKDNPIRPKNSGGTKKEEDVIGNSLAIQCKYTNNKNITLKQTDLNRLREASSSLEKLPLFVSGNCTDTLVSLYLDGENDNIIQSLVNLGIVIKSLKNLAADAKDINNIRSLKLSEKELSRIKDIFNKEITEIKKLISTITTSHKSKYDDLTMVDLFSKGK